jgi:hypothetical protein
MRAKEFLPENATAGATSSGSVATVAQPLGTLISRVGLGRPAKYMNSLTVAKRRTRNAGR